MRKCVFCEIDDDMKKRMLDENDYYYILIPNEPAMFGHLLVVAKKLSNSDHVKDISDKISKEQMNALMKAINKWSKKLKELRNLEGKKVEKVYVLTQCEKPHEHLHFHLKPRYEGDIKGDEYLYEKEFEEARWSTLSEKELETAHETDEILSAKIKIARKKIEKMRALLNYYESMIETKKWFKSTDQLDFLVKKTKEAIKN